jgi:hypothetical protein
MKAMELDGVGGSFLLLQSRLFIADTPERWKVAEQWGHLIMNTMEPKQPCTPLKIITDSSDFERYHLDMARLDVNVASSARLYSGQNWHRPSYSHFRTHVLGAPGSEGTSG